MTDAQFFWYMLVNALVAVGTFACAGVALFGANLNNSIGANNQYEFYNYSANAGNANPQEMGNQFLNGSSISSMALPFYTDFFNTGNNNGINIQDELYQLNANGSTGNATLQVQKAMNNAFANFLLYLDCSQQMTGNNGWPVTYSNSSNCSNPIGYLF
jgi:hypothetical protein